MRYKQCANLETSVLFKMIPMNTHNDHAPRESASSSPITERLPHAGRNGKIANLPNGIREQLNLRLLEGEAGRELVAWLNALPEVQSVLDSRFDGSPILEVNLT